MKLNKFTKEKEILNNEIIDLREKLCDIQTKTKEIKSKLENPTNIQNYKLLDKLIDGFTETLVVHWEDLVEALIDDILIDEVKLLNKREREKKYDLQTFDGFASFINDKEKNSSRKNDKQPIEFNYLKQIYDELLREEKKILIKHNIKN